MKKLIFYLCISINILAEIKDTTIGIYLAADNDLFPFAGRNLKQMQNMGSNEYINIVAYLHMHKPNNPKITKQLYIEKNKILQIGSDITMDSGSPETLITFCQWMITNYPAKNYILILWNHGTGDLEPVIKKAINPSKLFTYNSQSKMIELDRNKSFMNFIAHENNLITNTKGICFDDTTGNYLTNNALSSALTYIRSTYLNNNKFAMICFDACLQGGLGVNYAMKDHCNYTVCSQEVVLGTGYDYQLVLSPFSNGPIDTKNLAMHFVNSYEKTYQRLTNDYTHSAIHVSKLQDVCDSVKELSHTLIIGLKNQKNKSFKDIIKLSKHRNYCTSFEEPTYIDFGHFLKNLNNNLHKIEMNNINTNEYKNRLQKNINDTLSSLKQAIILNCAGQNLKHATGLSIYFPDTTIHHSYKECLFAIESGWLTFLQTYLQNKKINK